MGTSAAYAEPIEMTPSAARTLEAASRLFYERGIHAVGVDLIAAEAGVTKRTLYNRFGSKDRLVVEYLRTRDAQWRTMLTARLADPALSAPDRILAIFDVSRDWMTLNSPRGCSMVNAHAEISDPTHPAYEIVVGQKTWMFELFADLARKARFARPAEIAQTLMLLHEGALVVHGMHTFAQGIERARKAAGAILTTTARKGSR